MLMFDIFLNFFYMLVHGGETDALVDPHPAANF
jgi:hypothetical protein